MSKKTTLSETLLKANGCSSNAALLERSAPQGRRPLLNAEGRSSMFFDVAVNLLQSGQGVRFQAPGRSMKPTIREEETITVEPVTPLGVRKGDIILYNNHTGVIAHRVIRIQRKDPSQPPDSFILRGDASITDDKPVAAGQILGKVVSVERNGRTINLYSKRLKTMRLVRLSASRLKRWVKPLIFTNRH
jgi:signal peptidase I